MVLSRARPVRNRSAAAPLSAQCRPRAACSFASWRKRWHRTHENQLAWPGRLLAHQADPGCVGSGCAWRRQRTGRADPDQIQAARVGSPAQQGRPLDILGGRLPGLRPGRRGDDGPPDGCDRRAAVFLRQHRPRRRRDRHVDAPADCRRLAPQLLVERAELSRGRRPRRIRHHRDRPRLVRMAGAACGAALSRVPELSQRGLAAA